MTNPIQEQHNSNGRWRQLKSWENLHPTLHFVTDQRVPVVRYIHVGCACGVCPLSINRQFKNDLIIPSSPSLPKALATAKDPIADSRKTKELRKPSSHLHQFLCSYISRVRVVSVATSYEHTVLRSPAKTETLCFLAPWVRACSTLHAAPRNEQKTQGTTSPKFAMLAAYIAPTETLSRALNLAILNFSLPLILNPSCFLSIRVLPTNRTNGKKKPSHRTMFFWMYLGNRTELRWDFREKLISERVTLPDLSLFSFGTNP